MSGPYTIPNLLTGLRIALLPVIVVLFYLPYHWSDIASGLLFAVVGITDAFDGYLARKLGQVSPLGAFLDPVADKLIVVTALVLIVSKDPVWYVTLTAAVIIGREIAISALREWMSEIGARHKMQVSGVAKFKTIVQITGLSMMLFREDLLGLPIYDIGLVLTVLAAVLTLWSLVTYVVAAGPELRGNRGT
ncbi:MAG: CDP-diacylglycerol--glycerol-3-phosphate 3-phosphatidyltransferase [Gammaproteobacteria bacterium]|nr:CDP-diacylglycerol--glycerol-3-phosphate 3-phosphatidyltransferase [Gammaproteobacteria bacterium]